MSHVSGQLLEMDELELVLTTEREKLIQVVALREYARETMETAKEFYFKLVLEKGTPPNYWDLLREMEALRGKCRKVKEIEALGGPLYDESKREFWKEREKEREEARLKEIEAKRALLHLVLKGKDADLALK